MTCMDLLKMNEIIYLCAERLIKSWKKVQPDKIDSIDLIKSKLTVHN